MTVPEEDPQTGEMRREQLQRLREERRREERAVDEEEAETHGRRAERADYLREKLEERAAAEKEKLEEADERPGG